MMHEISIGGLFAKERNGNKKKSLLFFSIRISKQNLFEYEIFQLFSSVFKILLFRFIDNITLTFRAMLPE